MPPHPQGHDGSPCYNREVQLVAGWVETPARSGEGAEKLVVKFFHLVFSERSLYVTFIEWPVMGDKRKTLYQWSYLCPGFREDGLAVGVTARKAMNFGGSGGVIIGRRLD